MHHSCSPKWVVKSVLCKGRVHKWEVRNTYLEALTAYLVGLSIIESQHNGVTFTCTTYYTSSYRYIGC